MCEIISQLKSDLRDIKLYQILDNSKPFCPDIKRIKMGGNLIFNRKYWSIIKEWKGNSIITGSMALKCYGLLDREVNDIDLIIDKSKMPKNIKVSDRYDFPSWKSVIGSYSKKGYYVDLFELNGQSVIERNGLLFHHPLEIIEKKLEISPSRNDNKDIIDIITVFGKINPDYKFDQVRKIIK